MSRARWSCAASLLPLLSLGGCNLGPTPTPNAVDPKTYRDCAAVDGRALWAEAQSALQHGGEAQPRVLELLRRCIERCPDLVPAHIAYQDTALSLGGEHERAMVDYYAELADRDSPVPAYLRARLAETAYDQANALDSILAEHPGFAWAFLSRARVHRGQGRLAEALDDYDQARVEDRQLYAAVLERAQVLVELGRYEEGADGYRSYLERRPGDLQASREYVALLLYRLGRVPEARERIRALRAAGDDSVALRMDSAAASWRGGRPQAAIDEYYDVLTAPADVAGDDAARAALNIGLLYYEVLANDDATRRRFWPRARVAFRWFLEHSQPGDGHEQFEHTFGVPYRLRRIDEVLGEAPPADGAPDLTQLRWSD